MPVSNYFEWLLLRFNEFGGSSYSLFFDKFCDTAPLGERALDKVEHRFADTRLLWTPCYYRQFSLSLGKVRNIFSNFNPLNAVAC